MINIKKLLLLIAVCVSLCSCTGVTPALPQSFNVDCNGTVFTAEFSDGELRVSFSRPSVLDGLCITVNENGATADIRGKVYQLDRFAVKKLQTLFCACRAMTEAAPQLYKNDGDTCIYLYLLDGNEYLVYYNTEYMAVTGIEADGIYMQISGEAK